VRFTPPAHHAPASVWRRLALAALVSALAWALPAAETGDQPDSTVVSRISEEGLRRSQVMDTLSYLTDVHGSRLTNSPGLLAAADWAMARMKSWGVERVAAEPWGTFGRGWSNDRFVASVVEPTPWPILGVPKAWTPGTNGPVTAEAVLAILDREEDFAAWSGRLAGRVVLVSRERGVRLGADPVSRRWTDQELDEMARQRPLAGARTRNYGGRGGQFRRQLLRFLAKEGAVAVLEPGPGVGDHGSLLVMGNEENRHPDAVPSVPEVVVATEHYGRILRTLARNVPVRLELDIRNTFHNQPREAFNIIAELPGTDRAAEVVMLGAHFDSWHGGTGATDNAAGVATTMEALRILRVTGLPLRRTVRLALWTGEEQGLLGSRAYTARHFGNRAGGSLTAEHGRLSAYFNMDNGAGAIRGVYLEYNEAVRPVFTAWMAPFAAMGMTTTALRGTGGTDHVAFDELGLPAFQFIQDPLEYFTFSHHSTMDLYERVPAEDLTRNAVIIAAFVYQAANRDDLLPRKPMPAADGVRTGLPKR